MSLRDRFGDKASHLRDSALQAGSAGVQRTHESYRGFRATFEGDDDQKLSIERFLVNLVGAVRVDEEDEPQSDRDLYVKARKRRRRLGLISFAAGPLVGVASQVADLYSETATVCDVVAIHDLDLSDERIASHMLLLWDIADDLDAADRAIAGDPPIAKLLGGELLSNADGISLDLGQLTKRSAVETLWKVRGGLLDTVDDVRRGATSGPIKSVVFTGHRTKALIKRAEKQLEVR